MTTSGVRTAPAGIAHQCGTAGYDFRDGFDDDGVDRAFRLFMQPVKPAVALLEEVGKAGQHDDFIEDIGVRVVTVANGHAKSQPSCRLPGARLRHKLDYLWRSCTSELSEQNDLFRQTCALELAKQYDWVCHALSDCE